MKNVDSVFTTYLLFAIEKPLKEKKEAKGHDQTTKL